MRHAPRLFLIAGALSCLGGLVACSDARLSENRAPRPTGALPVEDGLIIGHRLMAAGEFDLALKAYYRAAAEQGMTVDTLSAIGSADLKLGRLGQAEQILRRAVAADASFVPALNNLGVVLMERGKTGEARQVFQQAFAQDSGQSDAIRENLRLAIARTESTVYDEPKEKPAFSLVRRDKGQFVLLSQL